jgi:hypothetical protein
MVEFDWYRCRFLESGENLRPLVKQRFGREPSAACAREIAACLQQGRLFYEAASISPLEIQPLLLFYGMVGFAKALIVARRLCSLSTLRHTHGIRDISADTSRIANLRLRIDENGTFQEFNDAIANLTRLTYYDTSAGDWRGVSIPSSNAHELGGIELSLRDILARIPSLESLYRMTFSEEPKAESMDLKKEGALFRVRFEVSQPIGDRDSIKRIVGQLRSKVSLLKHMACEHHRATE